MKLKKLKPITNGTRHQINIQKSLLGKYNQIDCVNKFGYKRCFGRSKITGNITVWHKGGGCKRLYREINFGSLDYIGINIASFYDAFRTAFIFLNFDLKHKQFFRTLGTNNIYPGSFIVCKAKLKEIRLGYRTQIKNIPTGSLIHTLEIKENKYSKYIRAAGTFGQILQRDYRKAKIRLPSNKIIEIDIFSYATIGIVTNTQNKLTCLGKAGRNRLKGRRPIVRGVAMNPVDHPHGGRTNGGRPSVTPWGLPTKCKFYLKRRKRKNE